MFLWGVYDIRGYRFWGGPCKGTLLFYLGYKKMTPILGYPHGDVKGLGFRVFRVFMVFFCSGLGYGGCNVLLLGFRAYVCFACFCSGLCFRFLGWLLGFGVYVASSQNYGPCLGYPKNWRPPYNHNCRLQPEAFVGKTLGHACPPRLQRLQPHRPGHNPKP